MTPHLTVCALAAALALGVAPAAAQSKTSSKGLWYVAVDAGMQVTSTRAASTVRYRVYGEDVVMNVSYKTEAAPVFGARVGARVWRRLTLGAGITRFTDSTAAQVEAQLPHPFFFQRPRSVEGTADAMRREELVACAEVGWVFAVHPRMNLLVFAGPAFFSATQEVATKPLYTETYPFDTASYSGVQSSTQKKTAAGFTVGADVTYRVTTRVGVGGLLRFSRATVKVDPVPGQPITLDLGGLQLSAGVRFRF
jgi:opacity protein-like surface antigen